MADSPPEHVETDTVLQQTGTQVTPPLLNAEMGTSSENTNIFSLDAFVAANKEQHEPEKQQKGPQNNNNNNSSSASTNSRDPLNAPDPIQPILISARSSKHIILLHEKCQALGIPLPVFTFQDRSLNRWTCEVSFPALADVPEVQGVGLEGTFASKGDAKEGVSRVVLRVLEGLEGDRRLNGRGVGRGSTEGDGVKKEVVNWVGMLQEFQAVSSSPQPTYTDYSIGTLFTAQVTLDGTPQPFGSLSTPHATKKDARQSAAKAAIQYLQDQGTWSSESFNRPNPSLGGLRKKKTKKNKKNGGGGVPITQQQQRSDNNNNNNNNDPNSPETTTTTGPSAASQAQILAHALGLISPEYRLTPHPSSHEFYNVVCYFKNGGEHSGPIGEVRNVFGKKRAKEECARLVVGYLEGVMGGRLGGSNKGGEGGIRLGNGEDGFDGEVGDMGDVFEDAVDF